jgi:hypothetical protein
MIQVVRLGQIGDVRAGQKCKGEVASSFGESTSTKVNPRFKVKRASKGRCRFDWRGRETMMTNAK